MLAAYIAAEAAVLKGLSYRIGDLQLTRADLSQIVAGRKEWERRVASENEVALGRQPGIALADFSGRRGFIEGQGGGRGGCS